MQDNIFYMIDKNLIKKNIKESQECMSMNLDSVIDGRCKFYGLGNDVISVAEKCKINYVIVNNLKEALEIRKYNDSLNIIIKYLENDYIDDAVVNDFVVTIYDYKDLEEIKKLKLKDDIRVMLFIDSGDNIEGFKSLSKIDNYQSEIKRLNILGAYSEIRVNKKNENFNRFLETSSSLSKDSLRFIIADKIYDTNVNYFGKNTYIKDIDNIVSLRGNIKCVKKFVKNDMFLNKVLKKEKHFGIINTPFKINVKKVSIKNKLYKVYESLDNYLILEIDNSVKPKSQVELFGSKSKNSLNDAILLKEISKYYLDGSSVEEAKFL